MPFYRRPLVGLLLLAIGASIVLIDLDAARAETDDPSVEELIESLGWDADAVVRGRAAEKLGVIGAVTEDVVPALIESLQWDDSLRVRWRAVEALERIGPAPNDVVAALLESLRADKYPGVRARAAEALGTIAPTAESVVSALTAAVYGDSHPGVRWQAARALEKCAISLRDAKATTSIAGLRKALVALETHAQPDVQLNAAAIRQAIEFMEAGANLNVAP